MKIFSINFINRTIQILLLFLFIINTGAAFYMPIFAVFITKYIVGSTLATVGIAVAIYAVTKSIVQLVLAKKLDSRAGEKDDFVVILIGAIIGISYSFAYLFINEVWQLNVLQLLVGVGDACTMAAYYAIFSHHIDRNSEGFEWSLLSVGGLTTSTALGGLIGGLLAEHYGFHTLFISAGILNIIGFVLLISLYPYIKILRKSKHYKTITDEK